MEDYEKTSLWDNAFHLRKDGFDEARSLLIEAYKHGFWVHERHEIARKVNALQQNGNSPSRLRRKVVYLSDFVRVFRAFRG